MPNLHRWPRTPARPRLAILLAVLVSLIAGLAGSVIPAQASVADSTLDPTFGSGGISDSTISVSRNDAGGVVALQPDGKVIVAGGSQGGFVPMFLAVVRLNRDGSPDPSFGVDGRVLIDRAFPTYTSGAYSMVNAATVDGAGRILLAGGQSPLAGSRPFVVRLLPDGRLDAAFGSGGAVVVALDPEPFNATATTVAALPDGRVVVGGTGRVRPEGSFATRLSGNGSIDRTFGSNGFVDVPVGSTQFVDGLGRTIATSRDEVDRWTASGSPDPGFGQAGRVTLPDVGGGPRTGAARPGGGILVLGGDPSGLLTTALAPDGSLDTSHGGGTGTAEASFDGAPNDSLTLLGLPSGGFVVAGGWFGGSLTAPAGGPALAAFLAGGAADSAFAQGRTVHTDLKARNLNTASLARAADGTLYAVVGVGAVATRDESTFSPFHDFVVTAYRSDGTAASGFGQGGTARIDFKAPGWVGAGPAAVDPLGRIVNILHSVENDSVVRLTPTGQLDPQFGEGGVVTLPADSLSPHVIATDARGDVVLGGGKRGDIARSALLRLTPDGRLDPTFGVQGLLTEPGPGDVNDVSALAVTPDGGIVTGTSGVIGGPPQVCIPAATMSRYLPDGQLDPGFGDGGRTQVVLEAPACIVTISGLAIDGRGNADLSVLGEARAGSPWTRRVLRLTPAGVPDPTFGTGGTVQIGLFGRGPLAVDRASGYIAVGGSDGDTLAAVRISPGGAVGPVLSHPSARTTGAAGTGATAWATGVTVDAQGEVQVFGNIFTELSNSAISWVAEAFRPDGSGDPRRGPDGILGEHSADPLTGAAQTADGHLVLAGFTERSFEARRYGVPTAASAPTLIRAAAGRNVVSVGWTAPTDDGGSTVNAYVVTARQAGGTVAFRVVAGDTRAVSLPGLANGQPASITIVAWNGRGPGFASPPASATPQAASTPPKAPAGPQEVTAGAGTTYVTAHWAPPAGDGGSPLTGYRVTAVDRGTGAVARTQAVAADVRSVSVGGLTAGRAYDLQVRASNQVGLGPSGSAAATPTTHGLPPAAPGPAGPIGASRNGANVAVSWPSPLDDGGGPVTGYTVFVLQGSTVLAARALPADGRQTTFSNIPAGASILVYAQNPVGYGPPALGTV